MKLTTDTSGRVAPIAEVQAANAAICKEIAKRVIGQHEVIAELLTAFFAGGHVLLVGVPGLAKTLLIRSFAEALGVDYNRIQFTPDLMPSDVTGTDVIGGEEAGDRGFTFLSGPIFTNVLLADEINRTPPKTQSALLEAMEEFQVTVAGQAYPLPEPFFVMATQNPIEQEGTYSLPLAALDRFIFNIEVDYPVVDEELEMLLHTTSKEEGKVQQVVSKEDVLAMLRAVRGVAIADPTLEYATKLVRTSRPSQSNSEYFKDMVEVGGSPRAIQALILGAKAHAALDGRSEALPSDIRAVAKPALRHRVMPSFHASADDITSDMLIEKLIETEPRPSNDKPDPSARRAFFNPLRWILGDPRPRKRKTVSLGA